MRLSLFFLEIHEVELEEEQQVLMPASLTGARRQSFSMHPSNTQLLSLNPLTLPGI